MVLIKNKNHCSNKSIIPLTKIKIYPEIGDLQASTYNALINSDMVEKTGYKIIFKKSAKTIEIDSFRNYSSLKLVFVISHIPCGR